MTASRPRTVIIGVGNPCRRDDGVGIAVMRQLRQQTPPDVAIVEASGEGAALMEAWKGATTVILVDAVHSGAKPGTIHRLDASVARISSPFFQCSTHAFGVAEAIELARALNQLPASLVLYGIEGGNFEAGVGLSRDVEQAARTVVTQVLEEVWSARGRA